MTDYSRNRNLAEAYQKICESITEQQIGNGYSKSLSVSENDYQILFDEVKTFWDSLKDGTNRYGMNVDMWNDAAENNSTDSLIGFLEFQYPSTINPKRRGLLYALELHDDGFDRGFSASHYYGDSHYKDNALISAFRSIFRALEIPFGKIPNDPPEQRIRKEGELFDWNLKTKSTDESTQIHEASDGNCVIVRYAAPCEKGSKEYVVRLTIDELQEFVEANGNPVNIQELLERMSEKRQADFDASAPITFNVERA